MLQARNWALVIVGSCFLLSAAPAAASDCEGWNTKAFFKSAKLKAVTDCLQAGAKVNARDKDGVTPLQWAAFGSETPAVVKTLLAAGAKVNARDKYGQTPLYWASSPAVVKALLAAGANLNARSKYGQTPLHSASSPAVVKALLAAGADLNARSKSGATPLHSASYDSEASAVMTALLDAGANLNARTKSGNTPLHVAAAGFSTLAVVRTLLDAGANPNARDKLGDTPLYQAVRFSKNPAVVEALLDAGADPRAWGLLGTLIEKVKNNKALQNSAAYWRLHDAQFDPSPSRVIALGLLGSTSRRDNAWPIVRVVDGDTVEVVVSGLPLKLRRLKVRLRWVDTPEKGRRAKCAAERAAARAAAAFTKKAIAGARSVLVRDPSWGKWGGRVVADLILDDRSLAATLIASGHGRRYSGGKRKGWCGTFQKKSE